VRRTTIWIGALVAIALGATGFAYLRFFQTPVIAHAKPTRGVAVEAVYATGTVEPLHYARVGSTLSGRVIAVHVAEGDVVEVGDTLAVIDAREEAARVEELEARLRLAADDLERTRTLRRSDHVSPVQLEQARNSHAAAVAALQAAMVRLDDHRIVTPIGGEILRAEDRIKTGDVVQAGKVLFLVGDPAVLQIDAEVDEEDVTKVAMGQQALLRADAFPDQALTGEVSSITPFGNPIARTYRLTIALPADTPLLSGMTTEINIVVRREDDALLVPVAALSGDSVWLVVDGRAKLRTVQLGAVGREEAEIRSGLSVADVVILNPPPQLKDGDRVRFRSAVVTND